MRRAPLRRLTPLKRTGPIKARGKSRGIDKALYAEVVLRDRGCVGVWLLPHVTCAGRIDPHHILRRSQGGPDTADNLVALCRVHHSFVHDHPEIGYRTGLLRRSWEAQ